MRILAVGIATLDIINYVSVYPQEDDEVRAVAQRIARGGNATNTLVALSQLGHEVAWCGSLADDDNSRKVLQDLENYQVDCSHVTVQQDAALPTSYITLSRLNGSRTIVHYRQLEEYSFADFVAVDATAYDWIHFEGRNIEQLALMLQHLRQQGFRKFSLEVEKHRQGIEELFSLPALLMFSRSYIAEMHNAGVRGFFETLRQQQIEVPVFCAWGNMGGWAMDAQGKEFQQPAWQPESVIDTLGAGDVFNAAVIDAHVRGLPVSAGLEFACRLAGYKCGIDGLAGLSGGI